MDGNVSTWFAETAQIPCNKGRRDLESRGSGYRRRPTCGPSSRRRDLSALLDGWACDDIGRVCSFFFAERAGARAQCASNGMTQPGPTARATATEAPRACN